MGKRFSLILLTLFLFSLFSVTNCAKKLNTNSLRSSGAPDGSQNPSVGDLNDDDGIGGSGDDLGGAADEQGDEGDLAKAKPTLEIIGKNTVVGNQLNVELNDSFGVIVSNITKAGLACVEIVGEADGHCGSLANFVNLDGAEPNFSSQAWQYAGSNDSNGSYTIQITPKDIYLVAGKTIKYFFYNPESREYSDTLTLVAPSLNTDNRPVVKAFNAIGNLVSTFGEGGTYDGSEVVFNCGTRCMGCTHVQGTTNMCLNNQGQAIQSNFVALGSEKSALPSGKNWISGPMGTTLINYEPSDYHAPWVGLTISHYALNPDNGKVSRPQVLTLY